MNTIIVNSSDLRQGDIVYCHGMRVLLDNPVRSNDHGAVYPTFWCNGLVLNRDEVRNEDVPLSFTATATSEHRWQVQGNDLTRWVVERAS